MKIPANEVERTLMLARDEVRQTDGAQKSESLTNLIAAFRHAAELRDTPMYGAIVRGRKDGIPRTVIVSTLKRKVGDNEYVACIQPYTEAERNGQRITRFRSRRVKSMEGELGYRWEMNVPAYAHIKWINRKRLEVA